MPAALFAIGLASLSVGLPLIAAETGLWDWIGFGLLVAGAVVLSIAWILRNERPQAQTTVAGIETASPPRASFDRAIADAVTELEAIQLRLEAANRTEVWRTALPSHYYRPAADALTDAGRTNSRRALDEAYNACDALQHRMNAPDRHWSGGPLPEPMDPVIEDGDDLAGVASKVEAAIQELKTLQTAATTD